MKWIAHTSNFFKWKYSNGKNKHKFREWKYSSLKKNQNESSIGVTDTVLCIQLLYFQRFSPNGMILEYPQNKKPDWNKKMLFWKNLSEFETLLSKRVWCELDTEYCSGLFHVQSMKIMLEKNGTRGTKCSHLLTVHNFIKCSWGQLLLVFQILYTCFSYWNNSITTQWVVPTNCAIAFIYIHWVVTFQFE